jgi:serine/threonine protein kinase
MAPEVFDLANYTEKVDVFSLGCILYEMLSAIRLFNAKTSEELIK